MIKKLLYPGIAVTLGLLITSGLYLTKERSYQERSHSYGQASEPYSMTWAMLDLRTGEYNPKAFYEAKSYINQRVSRGAALGMEFFMRGPDNVGGRTRAIIELYGEPDKLISGSVTGGLFYSNDGGGTWVPHDQFKNLDSTSSLISSIAQDTVTGDIYVGTGCTFDQFYGGYNGPGYGIFKSEDGGETFFHLTSTAPDNRYAAASETWHGVNRIQIGTDGSIYAATEAGLQVSSDGGATWTNPVFVDPGQTIPNNGTCADVSTGRDGSVLVSFASGSVYLLEEGTFVQINDRGLTTGAARTVCQVNTKNPNYMYVMFIQGDGCMKGLYKSTDGGTNWSKILEPFDTFSPMSGNSDCQGIYDAAMASSAKDPNTVYIGGVELWRFDGSLTRVATEGGSPPFLDVQENYVHSDKHFFYQSPNNPKRMYVTTDGGIAKTETRGNKWQGLSKGYITTQYYGIAHGAGGGVIIGGTQDNGTLAVLGANSFDPNLGYSVYPGVDGIDCEIAQSAGILFATSQNGGCIRADFSLGSTSQQPPSAFISFFGSGTSFMTRIKLWESKNDITSQDSVVFSVEPTEFAVATGNGILRNFNESFTPVQPAAKVIESSVKVKSSGMTLSIDPENPGQLIGDGEGTVTFNEDKSINISVTFASAPSENANILVSYEERYDANDVLILESQNLRTQAGIYTFEHRLENNLNPGDEIKVQDPVQSYLLSTGDAQVGGALRFYRNVLNAQAQPPRPIAISGLSGTVTAIEISNDGDVAFVGMQSGSVYRLSGLKEVYNNADALNIQSDLLFNIGGPCTGIALDRTDNNRVVVTGGGFGSVNRVRYSEDALSANPVFVNAHGDLASIPVYDAEFNINNPNEVLIGTDFGVWATKDITAGTGTVWEDENHEFSTVPVYDIRQQWRPFDEAPNSGVVYLGTFGKGMWESTTLVGTQEVPDLAGRNQSISGMKVYPNPVQGDGMLSFDAGFNGQVNVSLYDFNGRQVTQWTERVASGNNRISFNTSTMRTGTYFVIVDGEGIRQSAKFIVMN